MTETNKSTVTEKEFDINAEDPEAKYRTFTAISYAVLLFAIGLPVWWFTTRVYRASLPLYEMYELELPNRADKQYGLPLSLEYDILITIVNHNPKELKVDLDGELLDLNLQPFLSTITSVSNFTVKSQWLYLTNLGVVPKKFNDYYVLQEEQLTHIITPLEKKLWSQISSRPTINLVVYFPDCKAPLYIHDLNGNKLPSNSFLSPQWGAVLIVNPDSCGVFKPDLTKLINVFVTQLETLLQIKSVHEFKLTRIREMLDATRRTLKSLAQLLYEISRIVISDDVAKEIKIALENALKAEEALNEGNIELALVLAKIAYKYSETAFSDPSLLALLYFPDDQKYAIYIPLFLPIVIPVIMSIGAIRKSYRKSKIKVD